MALASSKPYDYRNCQSLFGYAAATHARSGGICQLCGAGQSRLDFDLWRQLTVEHLIGEGQGGYPPAITRAIGLRFPALPIDALNDLARAIDVINTVTACSFCNSTTSRTRARQSIPELLDAAQGPEECLELVRLACEQSLQEKRAAVQWKLVSVREAFETIARPAMDRGRSSP